MKTVCCILSFEFSETDRSFTIRKASKVKAEDMPSLSRHVFTTKIDVSSINPGMLHWRENQRHLTPTFWGYMVKRISAYGGCLGGNRR